MTRFVALLRAVNVGGAGKLAMADLKSLCRDAGFDRVETYIASGNVVFESKFSPEQVKSELVTRLLVFTGKPIGVILRTATELRAVLQSNPFPNAKPSHTVAIFLDRRSPSDALDRAAGMTNEEMRLGLREIFVHYPSGMARSKLKIPAARFGTARNMNTVAKLVELASAD